METPTPVTPEPSIKTHWLSKVGILLVIIFGFVSAFGGGYFLRDLLREESGLPGNNFPTIIATPISSALPNSEVPFIQNEPGLSGDVIKYLLGKHYFDDTVILVAKDAPHYSIVATAARQEGDSKYAQNFRVSYFNGESWVRKQSAKTSEDAAISTNDLLKEWVTKIDPSRVLKESAMGNIKIENNEIKFSTGVLQNEIAMRSLPGYTKFMSKGKGTLTVNGQNYEAYVLYTRTYSLNAADIQFYDQPFGVTTDWVVFWDTNGNMYHIDSTSVEKPSPIYQTHMIGILDTSDKSIMKTFDLNVSRSNEIPPTKYTINLKSPINQTLELNLLNSINKAPNNSFKWFMGQVKGSVNSNGEKVEGIGLVEYIND